MKRAACETTAVEAGQGVKPNGGEEREAADSLCSGDCSAGSKQVEGRSAVQRRRRRRPAKGQQRAGARQPVPQLPTRPPGCACGP